MGTATGLKAWLAALAGISMLAASSADAARPKVLVAEFCESPGKVASKARTELVEALLSAGELEVLSWPRAKAAADKKKIKAKDLCKAQKLLAVAKSMDADGVVTGGMKGKGAKQQLQVQVHDMAGNELWEKGTKLKKNKLPGDMARKLAAGIGAALGAGRSPPPPPPPVVESTPEIPRNVEPTDPFPPPAKEDPFANLGSKDEGRRDVEAEPRVRAEGSSLVMQDPFVELTAGFRINWRSYRFCPEVEDCDVEPPAGAGSPVKYSTDTPFGGFMLDANIFPLARIDGFLSGFGVGAGFVRSITFPTIFQGVEHDTSQQRWTVDAQYRYRYRLSGAGQGWVALRAGYMSYAFVVEGQPQLESKRAGLQAQLELAFPLQRFVKLHARGNLIPIANPGATEREVHGNDVTGGGFGGSLGLSTDFGHPDWHIGASAEFELNHFGDRYTNDAGRPAFGRALEDASGLSIGLRGTL